MKKIIFFVVFLFFSCSDRGKTWFVITSVNTDKEYSFCYFVENKETKMKAYQDQYSCNPKPDIFAIGDTVLVEFIEICPKSKFFFDSPDYQPVVTKKYIGEQTFFEKHKFIIIYGMVVMFVILCYQITKDW